jgi:hypothetical protein
LPLQPNKLSSGCVNKNYTYDPTWRRQQLSKGTQSFEIVCVGKEIDSRGHPPFRVSNT